MRITEENGTQIALNKMEEARKLLGDAYEIIVKINKGIYKEGQGEIQFEADTCSQLGTKLGSLGYIVEKISDVIY